jgi:hypothetical protein
MPADWLLSLSACCLSACFLSACHPSNFPLSFNLTSSWHLHLCASAFLSISASVYVSICLLSACTMPPIYFAVGSLFTFQSAFHRLSDVCLTSCLSVCSPAFCLLTVCHRVNSSNKRLKLTLLEHKAFFHKGKQTLLVLQSNFSTSVLCLYLCIKFTLWSKLFTFCLT